jgi:hypothetical protein
LLFAEGIVSTGMYERDIAITPDGEEIYFGVTTSSFAYSVIMVTKQIDGRWTDPEVAPFSGNPGQKDLEPCISPDGQKFFFLSTRPPEEGESGNEDIWAMDRLQDGWGIPYNLGAPINTERGEYFPSVTRDGTLYFTRDEEEVGTSGIYRSRLIDGHYQEPERLPDVVNSTPAQFNAYVAPDESYLIVCVYGREDSHGATDYYICYRAPADTWTGPINLGEKVNTEGGAEYSPYVSPDGNYFFFMSSRMRSGNEPLQERLSYATLERRHNEPRNGNADVYWINADFIAALRPE